MIILFIFLIIVFLTKNNIENFVSQKQCNKCMKKNFKRYRNFNDAKGRCIGSDSCDTNMAFKAKYAREKRRNRKFRRRRVYWGGGYPSYYRSYYSSYPYVYIPSQVVTHQYDYSLYDCVNCINSIKANHLTFDNKFKLCANVGRCNIYR